MTDESAAPASSSSTAPAPSGAGAVEVIPSLYDFILWMAPKVAAFPRIHRFTLGDRIMTLLMEVLDGLIVARYHRARREAVLQEANVGLERLRYLVRLSRDLRCLSNREYEYAARHLVETGRRVGGWLRHARAPRPARGTPRSRTDPGHA